MDPKAAAEKAVAAIGLGYDVCRDVRLTACKALENGSRLVELDPSRNRDLAVPGGVVVADVAASIRCDKGERTRFRSDVLSFNQMSELFNKELCLSGKIPSGQFNTMFGFNGCWQKDAAPTKSLAFDGWFISLYNIELERSNIALSKDVIKEVPNSWDPPALAEFIEKYGTHIVVGVKMGGKDVVHVKQSRSSNLQPNEVRNLLKKLADERFSEASETSEKTNGEILLPLNPHDAYAAAIRHPVMIRSFKDDVTGIYVRKGGSDFGQSHKAWLSTVSRFPNVISMSLVPITSLLGGVQGNGFLSHAVNLYLRYKPNIEELEQFLEFQLPRQWAPEYGDLPLTLKHRKNPSPSLRFTLLGPQLYVNTTTVDSGSRPVTGLRLHLEGERSDHLAIHLQHLTSLPESLRISGDHHGPEPVPNEHAYFEPVKWTVFSHVCTAPVESTATRIDHPASVVTKAWLQVKPLGIRNVLFLRLGFSAVESAKIRRAEWAGPASSSRRSGFMSVLMSTKFSGGLGPPEKAAPAKVDVNSAVYPGGPPVPARAPRAASLVDTEEKVRGPEDPPGYWVVSGAKLCVDSGRISVKVKYSLLTITTEDSMLFL